MSTASRRARLVLGSTLVLLVAAAAVMVWLRPVEGVAREPGIVVAASTTVDGTVSLQITASGLDPGAEYGGQLYASDDGRTSASSGFLGRFIADDDGNGSLSTSTATIAAGAEILLTEELFTPPGAVIAIVSVQGKTVATVTVIVGPLENE